MEEGGAGWWSNPEGGCWQSLGWQGLTARFQHILDVYAHALNAREQGCALEAQHGGHPARTRHNSVTGQNGGHDAVALAEGFTGLMVGIRIHGPVGLRGRGRRAGLLLALRNGRNRGGNLQWADVQAGAAGKNDRALDNVGKLAHVAGPELVAEPAQAAEGILVIFFFICRAICCVKCFASRGMSSRRSRSGGMAKCLRRPLRYRQVFCR